MKKTFYTPLLLLAPLAASAQDSLQSLHDTLRQQLEPALVAAAGGLAKTEDMLTHLSGELGALTGELGAFSAREMGASRVVKGAPYCADAINESVQTLADGNRIVRKSSTRWCRDGEGRTRQETERGGRTVVYLRDPVAKQNWTLDPQNKSAVKLGGGLIDLNDFGVPIDTSVWRDYAERMREWARGFADRMRSGSGEKPGAEKNSFDPVVITQAETQGSGGDTKAARGKEVYVIRMNNTDAPPPPPPLPPVAPVPPAPPVPGVGGQGNVAMLAPPVSVRMLAPRGQGVQTSLGSKDFDGVKANGEKTTWTIEAGKFGNEKPIVIVSEKWTSPELMLTVYARDFDPRSGETVYKLTNLKRGEPDAALFKVPADFKVREGKPFGWRMHEAPAKPADKGE